MHFDSHPLCVKDGHLSIFAGCRTRRFALALWPEQGPLVARQRSAVMAMAMARLQRSGGLRTSSFCQSGHAILLWGAEPTMTTEVSDGEGEGGSNTDSDKTEINAAPEGRSDDLQVEEVR